MAIAVVCPNGHQLRIRDEYEGRNVRCPSCQAIFQVPARLPPGRLAEQEEDELDDDAVPWKKPLLLGGGAAATVIVVGVIIFLFISKGSTSYPETALAGPRRFPGITGAVDKPPRRLASDAPFYVTKDGRDDKALVDWDNGKQPGDFIFRLQRPQK